MNSEKFDDNWLEDRYFLNMVIDGYGSDSESTIGELVIRSSLSNKYFSGSSIMMAD